MSLRIQVGDEIVPLAARRVAGAADRFVVQIGDDTLEVGATRAPDGSFLLDLGDGQRFRAEVSRDGDARWVTVAGRTALLHKVESQIVAGEEESGLLETPMPGKVVVVAVSPGDTVEAGETLVVVEAMKMEHPIRARRGGVVAEVTADGGEMVGAGTALVILEGGP
jgi:geranyl-CoA carboxylase alpha subunit